MKNYNLHFGLYIESVLISEAKANRRAITKAKKEREKSKCKTSGSFKRYAKIPMLGEYECGLYSSSWSQFQSVCFYLYMSNNYVSSFSILELCGQSTIEFLSLELKCIMLILSSLYY